MALNIVKKNGRTEHILDEHTGRALRLWWKGVPDQLRQSEVGQLLSQMHRSEHWIACDCSGEGADRPMLVPVKRDKTISLRRLSTRNTHSERCEFWFEQVELLEKPAGGGAGGVARMGSMPSFIQASSKDSVAAVPFASVVDDERHTGEGQLLTTMARRLFWLATHAGLQQNHSPQNSVQVILKAASHIYVADDLQLSKILFWDTRVWHWASDVFARCRKASLAPQCYWLRPIVGADPVRNTLTFDLGSPGSTNLLVVPVNGVMKAFGGDWSPARFPMLALCSLAPRSDGEVVLHQAYAQPIVSDRRWMLLDSDLERTTYDDLDRACTWLARETGIAVTIEKPLFEWQQSCERPDFVLSVRSRTGSAEHLIVETMGYSDEIYEARKSKLAERVQVPVLMDRRKGSPIAGEDLRRAVAEWAISKAG